MTIVLEPNRHVVIMDVFMISIFKQVSLFPFFIQIRQSLFHDELIHILPDMETQELSIVGLKMNPLCVSLNERRIKVEARYLSVFMIYHI